MSAKQGAKWGVGVLGLAVAGILLLGNGHSVDTQQIIPAAVNTPASAALPAKEEHPMTAKTDPVFSAPTEVSSDPDEDAVAEPPQSGPEQLRVGENREYPTLGTRLQEMQARREGQTYAPYEVLAALTQAAAWAEDDSLAQDMPVSDAERTDGRVFIRFDPLKIESLMPGDFLEIPLPQARTQFQMQVERVTVEGQGNVTWQGRLKNFEQENQVSITQSQGLTYGGIITPEATYVIQAYGRAGWIVDGGILFKGEEVDTVVPPLSTGGATPGHPH